MKIHTLFATSALAAFALATPIEYADALDRRQAGTTVIPACATATGTATPVAPSTIASATAGCVGVVTFGQNTIRNDIVDGVCKPFTLIFARGTSENMNMGNLVGPPFVLALEQAFGGSQNVAVQGVNNYPADVAGFCAGGSSTGSANMAQVLLILFFLTAMTRLLTTVITADRANRNPMPKHQTLHLGLQPRRAGGPQRC